MICDCCWLVQTDDFVRAEELFSDNYSYFSSFSSTWLEHAKTYVEKMTLLFGLNDESTVVEVAANDGYLLQYFQDKSIPCYGIEPTHSTAQAAKGKGIEIIEAFFGAEQARELQKHGRQADLVVANNVLAHVPDINDFVEGFSILLKPAGVATFEFPHLLKLVEQNQFDTIYHEHYSYLSLTSARTILEANGLTVFDVEELPTHGGSLRIYAQRSGSGRHPAGEAVKNLQKKEHRSGISSIGYYQGFQSRAEKIRADFLLFLHDAKEQGKNVAAYGAAAKGNTLLNFAGVGPDLLPYVVDKNPVKQGRYMPGSQIPIVEENKLEADKPDYVLILPWNLKKELMSQLEYIRRWGGQFVVTVPELEVL